MYQFQALYDSRMWQHAIGFLIVYPCESDDLMLVLAIIQNSLQIIQFSVDIY